MNKDALLEWYEDYKFVLVAVIFFLVGFLATIFYSEDRLTWAVFESRVTILYRMSTIITAVFGLFVGLVYRRVLDSLYDRTVSLTVGEMYIRSSLVFAVLASVVSIFVAVIMTVWGGVVGDWMTHLLVYAGTVESETTVWMNRIGLGIIDGLLFVELYAIGHALHPILVIEEEEEAVKSKTRGRQRVKTHTRKSSPDSNVPPKGGGADAHGQKPS